MNQLLLFNKPFNVLSQFTDDGGRATLKDYLHDFPGFYAAGRLDYDSEGLMILTNDGDLQQLISNPKNKQYKTYWVQVEGIITDAALEQLKQGVVLKDGKTLPAMAESIQEPNVWARIPPIRVREKIPTSWLSLSICEGKNRQVRRMTAAVGFPTLRLIRAAIADWHLHDLQPGMFKLLEVEKNQFGRQPTSTRKSHNNYFNKHKKTR